MQDVFIAFTGIAILLALAKVFGLIAEKLNAPSIAGELMVGLLLGPTILGPFEFATNPIFQNLVEVALLLFLVSTGGHLDLRAARMVAGRSFFISMSGIAIPFLLAVGAIAMAPSIFSNIAGPHAGSALQVSLFFGLALAISAVPVVAKILMDLGLYESRVGVVIITSAVATDVAAWILFAFIGGAGGHGAVTVGAFLLGVALSSASPVKSGAYQKALRFITTWLAPIFFASIGLKANFSEHFDLRLVVSVFCLACAGKLLGCGLAARAVGFARPEAGAIAFGLNARGAMEIILSLTALNQGLISARFFEALVIMAFVTALMSGPIIQSLLRASVRKDPA